MNLVELLAFLTAPGLLTIRQGSDVRTYNAPAGLVSLSIWKSERECGGRRVVRRWREMEREGRREGRKEEGG